jgi:hypothetical protein
MWCGGGGVKGWQAMHESSSVEAFELHPER